MIKNFLALLFLLAVISCGAFGQRVYRDISVNRADSIINATKDSSLVLLDVRTPAEYDKGHLEDAVLINILKRGFRRKLSGLDRDASYLVYCATGGRSARAMKIMKKKKFRKVYNMVGGIRDWTKEGYDIIIEEKKN